MKRYTFKVISLGLFALIIGLYFGGINKTEAATAKQPQNQDTKLKNKKYEFWEYDAYINGEDIYINISNTKISKHNLVDALDKDKQRKVALKKITSTFPVVILFKNPMGPESFEKFVQKEGIEVENYTLQATDSHGESLAIFGAPEGNDVFPEEILATVIGGLENQQGTKVTVSGVVALKGMVDYAQLELLEKHKEVFAVDITPALAIEDFLQDNPDTDMRMIQVTPLPLWWLNK